VEKDPPVTLLPQTVRNNFDWVSGGVSWDFGTYQVRVRVGCMTANDTFRMVFNHWQNFQTADQAETFLPVTTPGLQFTYSGSALLSQFAVPISSFDFFSPGANGTPWSWSVLRNRLGFFTYPEPIYGIPPPSLPAAVTILDATLPYDLRFSVVNVAPGGTFSGWSNYTTNGFGERTYDCAFPTPVTITAPANGATVTGATTITATATDTVGITLMEFLVDGITQYKDDLLPYTFSYDFSAAGLGAHAIVVRAWDAAGNSNTATISVTK
jgi:hypothetical protein